MGDEGERGGGERREAKGEGREWVDDAIHHPGVIAAGA